ncbi:class I lanthipeptide [Aquimarina sp. U1-2]|uniref:class I lanthipeptide n=1 Tax=Aquimarina sp. U1-2 TaxID=2823141 RepID=UPI001AEC857D|nr:class I lanthipeptide [Aquimarina sp. U1-2]MBP2833390.1 class I lanthipeptide [Aquimarina sp. U1-2]
MKNQKFTKRLKFDKISVSELDSSKLATVNGGTATATIHISDITSIVNMSKNTICTSDAR